MGISINSRAQWEELIVFIVGTLEKAGIRYHIDASSSLYAQGVEFDMDDLDLTVEWGKLEAAHQLFSEYRPSNVTTTYPPSFRFYINSNEVHLMSYESESGVGEASNRVKTVIGNQTVWCKSIAFYMRHMEPDHRLWEPLNQFLNKTL